MGIGDEIMAAAQARALFLECGRRVRILDRRRRPRWHEIWAGLPFLTPDPKAPAAELVNGPGARPYIVAIGADRFCWRPFGPPRGEIHLAEHERQWADRALRVAGVAAGRFLVVEPNIKAGASRNKDWGFGRWQTVADGIVQSGTILVQLGAPGARRLAGVRQIETPAPRLAFAILARAAGYLGHEGAMHHAAAAFGLPAVVVFGGFISPAVTGYPGQLSFFQPTPEWPIGCGARQPCSHCETAMASITVPAILDAAANLKGVMAHACP